MKLGAEGRNKTIFAVVLALLAAYLVWHNFFGGGPVIASPPPPAAQSSSTASLTAPLPRRERERGHRGQPVAKIVINPLDPRLQLALLNSSANTEYEGSGRNIFVAQAEPPIPAPVKNPIVGNDSKPTPQPPANPGPPPPPPIPLKFFGFATRPGGPRQIFLSEGDYVFVAKEGDVVNRRYKILKINPKSVDVEDLLNNRQTTIQLTAGTQ